jgi:hypothetical protein
MTDQEQPDKARPSLRPSKPDDSNTIRQQRQRDLRDNIAQAMNLLKQYEDAVLYEDDPGRTERYRRQIGRLRELAADYQKEYDDLKASALGEPSAALDDLGVKLQEVDTRLDRLNPELNPVRRCRPPLWWFAGGLLCCVIVAIVFLEQIRCMVAYRLTEAATTLVVALVGAGVAALAVRLGKVRESLGSLGGGAALGFAASILFALLSPLPPEADCSPGLTGAATPIPCGTPHPPIDGTDILGTVTIEQPADDCVEVGKSESIEVVWDGVQDGVTMWVLVYSPLAQQYYPHQVELDPLPTSGRYVKTVFFGRAEPYDVIVVLADDAATSLLHDAAKTGGLKVDQLPGGIEEKDTISVVQSP